MGELMILPITVGVATRNRPDSLRRCVRSLQQLGRRLGELIVVDDGSMPPVADVLRGLADGVGSKLDVVRQEGQGYIAARNKIARLARHPYVFLCDDDAEVLDPSAVDMACRVLDADHDVVAVAFAQADGNGTPWPAGMQPAAVDYACYVPTFIGFAHLLRRDAFLRLEGYRESFEFYGEEKEFCLRVWDSGGTVVYLPDALVAHHADPAGRDLIRYFRSYTRNDCLNALYNLPLPVAVARVFSRWLHFRSTALNHVGVDDADGRGWLVSELKRHMPSIWRERRPVRWQSLVRFRSLKRRPIPYALPVPLPGPVVETAQPSRPGVTARPNTANRLGE